MRTSTALHQTSLMEGFATKTAPESNSVSASNHRVQHRHSCFLESEKSKKVWSSNKRNFTFQLWSKFQFFCTKWNSLV